MTQLTHNPAYEVIADRLDAIGQKYRAHTIVRGALLWIAFAGLASFLAAAAAHLVGPSRANYLVLGAWTAWMLLSFIAWFLRPLMLRPRPVEVARMVESRIDGLHNGLTNSVLLAAADDLQDNPWLPAIYQEILSEVEGKPLDSAIRLSELRRVALRLGCLWLLMAVLLGIPAVRSALGHGWWQMFSPTAFVPREGGVQILDIQPKDITLVAGQPMEITVLARDSGGGTPAGTLLFGDGAMPAAQMPSSPADGGAIRYAYRLSGVDRSMRYRVEIGDTQSPWFHVKVVREVKLRELHVAIAPPSYTRQPTTRMSFVGGQPASAVSAPEGSKVELAAAVDVPAGGALLEINEKSPVQMRRSMDGLRFDGGFTLLDNASAVVLLTEGAGQVIARLPDPPLAIACVKDTPPAIEMRWPTADVSVPPTSELKVRAVLKDDHGLGGARVLLATEADHPLAPVAGLQYAEGTTAAEMETVLAIKPELRRHGVTLRVQIEAMDNRDLRGVVGASPGDGGVQTTTSAIYEIRFRDERQIAAEKKEQADRLRQLLQEMLRKQQGLHATTLAWKPADKSAMAGIESGQQELRQMMQLTAETFAFGQDDKLIQKTLLVLAASPAREAVELAAAIQTEPVAAEQVKSWRELQSRQRRIIDTLERMLAYLAATPDPTTRPTTREGGDLADDQAEKFKKLNEALKEFIKEEQRILDATAHLAKKPVDNFDDKDKKLLEDLVMAQEKMDAFIQEKVSDFSKLAEQDMANASLLKELMEVYSEVTMAKDALKAKAVEIAVPLEESGLELAKEISSNLEKWLMDTPDRQKWTMEEPIGKTDTPMAELPAELEDMVGELMEQQEDLFEEMEDAASAWADSLDKGAGWDAMDGPIANMTAKGVTGNQLPNDMEIGGRSGEGRSGKSSGEMVEETASGKGGRNTPTRLDPTPFQQGEVKDTGTDPTGGATGGGKTSGQGGAGLEGPVPPKLQKEMERLTQKQAEIRNAAERLELKHQVGRYDGFSLLESIALMRRVESDLKANRYVNALRRRDVMLDRMDTSRLLLAGRIHTQQDTSPGMNDKLEDQINDAMKGRLPAAWSEALKEYYRKLAAE